MILSAKLPTFIRHCAHIIVIFSELNLDFDVSLLNICICVIAEYLCRK